MPAGKRKSAYGMTGMLAPRIPSAPHCRHVLDLLQRMGALDVTARRRILVSHPQWFHDF
jgi:hypothetical protein